MERYAKIDVFSLDCELAITIADHTSFHNIVADEHTGILVKLPEPAATFYRVRIDSLRGSCSVGKVQFNHSWTLNNKFLQHHPELYNRILDRDYDIGDLNRHELDLIKRYGMFRCSGDSDYHGWQEFRLNVCLNNLAQPLHDINDNQTVYSIQSGDSLYFDLTVPKAACLI
jgi:hypothetical protein